MKIVIATGGFDPIHSGHIAYLNAAKKLGDSLMVGLNSDAWLERKKGRAFMPFLERENILMNIKAVDTVYGFDDRDGSACQLLEWVKEQFPYAEIVFANGGDRTRENIPEMQVEGVEFVFGVGGEDKANSSSWILEDWKAPKTYRPWGYYRVLYDIPGTKVKELVVDPGKSLSMQRHKMRSEYWKVTEGMARIVNDTGNTTLGVHGSYFVARTEWHQLSNPFPAPLKIVEIQYGPNCTEEDIERR
ncbi:Cytidyltransferase-like domain [uncultured Caudovirales phage]|uniref:Cytidyltransferase-like domain n=1 Tax=uncultured Caudovirales phage TaxID=2100421 RepID=A0A6J5L6W2_9CAUD|nr:Cytidyltransferase-like domain [uncultured Caudovirales phage]